MYKIRRESHNLPLTINTTRHLAKRFAFWIPVLGSVLRDRERILQELRELRQQLDCRPGTYYSPIPDMREIEFHLAENEARIADNCLGIDMALDKQHEWLQRIASFYPEQPFPEESTLGCRHCLKNDFFEHSDSIFLYGLIRTLRPKRIVEIGSGYSSAVMLDTNERFFEGQIRLTFIDPNPQRLYGLLNEADRVRTTIVSKPLQQINDAPWDQLEENDILFTDSSHVVKCGSDVQLIFDEILPRLRPGVVVHIHDIGKHFEYPAAWLKSGRAWNEAYFLRTFLQFNSEFEILLWAPMVVSAFFDEVKHTMPLCLKQHGGSFWMRRKRK
jgi:predicted O-methyltransferase YrrM